MGGDEHASAAMGAEPEDSNGISREDLLQEVQRLRKESNEYQLDKCRLQRECNEFRDLITSMVAEGSGEAAREMGGDLTLNATKVVDAFRSFLKAYYMFKEHHKLPHRMDNPYHTLVAITDKLGRIARNVKHWIRGDEKDDWKLNVERDCIGILAYMVILGHDLDIQWSEGMMTELIAGVEQHGGTVEPVKESDGPAAD